jgi:hypothetical protein
VKIKSPQAPVTAPTNNASKPAAAKPAAPASTAAPTGWGAKSGDAKRSLISQATDSVMKAISAGDSKHPMLEKFGEGLGKALGVVVTEALALAPKWNAPVLGADGKPVQHVEGADRIGNHDILQRHQEVVGPKIAALVQKMPPGAIHDLLEGLGKGATEAPGDSYRLEAAVGDALKKL